MRSLPIYQRRREDSPRKATGSRSTHPVAEKVVDTDVDEDADAPLEEALEIELSGEHGVEARVETSVKLPVYPTPILRGEVGAQQSPRLGTVEVGRDVPV